MALDPEDRMVFAEELHRAKESTFLVDDEYVDDCAMPTELGETVDQDFSKDQA